MTPRHRTDRPRVGEGAEPVEPPANPYFPFKPAFARESLYVITEPDEVFADRKTFHAYHRDEHLGAWPDPPKTEGPLKEEFAAGRVLYRATLPDGRVMVVPSVAWTGGCCCPSRFAPGGGCVGCSAVGRAGVPAPPAPPVAAKRRERAAVPHETHAGGQSGGQQSLGIGGEE